MLSNLISMPYVHVFVLTCVEHHV